MSIQRTLLASVIVAAAGGTILMGATDRFQAFTTETARRVALRQHPVATPAVVMLETQSGARINLADLRGQWLLIDFIYTRCSTSCVALGDEFAQLQDRLGAPLARGSVRLLSISFDPAHDTPARLATYLQRSRSRAAGWLAARPVTPEGLAQIKRVFGITIIPNAQGGYTHNAAIHIVDPRGRLVAILDRGNPGRVARILLRELGQ
ncbi:SCO family protein [Nitrococcus mobilis]|uniref:Electron transport protein SCO1/SenC n=1 Tax=Nitrococcus mobilis Nb-231 TaxID=314278 RepID=A4BSP6_9GAMM|nr:SCO family protein [Nitrococcus mobilis]EAR21316.1 Electron transport protein SCO1/SenC [Nitrococcus mobilis Nb-231]